MQQLNNAEAYKRIQILSQEIAEVVALLQADVEPDVVDTRKDDGDEYEPHMHNDLPGGGALFPNLDRRWLAIGITDIQKGLMSLRRATGHGAADGDF